MIESEFPEVRHISADALAGKMREGSAPPWLLLDIREPAEFGVSHLKSAKLAPDAASALTLLAGTDKSREIVVYCSVGYRSSEVAQALRQAGYRNTVNLRGGIFGWANAMRPLYRGNRRVSQVHPYNRDWGRLLEKRFHSSGL